MLRILLGLMVVMVIEFVMQGRRKRSGEGQDRAESVMCLDLNFPRPCFGDWILFSLIGYLRTWSESWTLNLHGTMVVLRKIYHSNLQHCQHKSHQYWEQSLLTR